jgi:hypothetical protein
MTRMMRGPAIFLAQFAGDAAPFDSLLGIAGWPRRLATRDVDPRGTRGCSISSVPRTAMDCDEVKRTLAQAGGIDRVVNAPPGPARGGASGHDEAFDGFAPVAVRGRPSARQHGRSSNC